MPRALVLRAYAVASRDRYAVMPGGLARVARSADNPEVSMQVGAGSKDTWVLSSGPSSSFSLLPPASHPVELSRGGGDLPSRVADNLYWLGRYAERAEGIARLARVTVARLHDAPLEPGASQGQHQQVLLRALAAETEVEGGPFPLGPGPGAALSPARSSTMTEDQLLATVLGRRGSNLSSVITKVLWVARTVRDRLSADTWRVLTALDDEVDDPADPDPGPAGASGPAPASGSGSGTARLDRTVLALAAFSGLAMESMTRGQAWRFLDMGRRLERASALVQLLGRTLVEHDEAPLLEAILEVADSGMTYRRRYLATLQLAPVLDLLLLDETNPRSVMFQLRALVDHLAALPAPAVGGARTPQQRIGIATLAELQLADAESARGDRPDGQAPRAGAAGGPAGPSAAGPVRLAVVELPQPRGGLPQPGRASRRPPPPEDTAQTPGEP